MKRRLYGILIILGIAVVLAAVFIFWQNYQVSEILAVNFLDVGQGDAILIQSPYGQNILIDGGPDATIMKRLAEELPWWERVIDLMVLTHPHSDHVDGLIDVLKRYQVKKIIYTGVIHDSPGFLTWLNLIKEKNIPLTIIDRPQTINLGEACAFEIIYPRESFLGKEVNNLNNTSIVARLDCLASSFLFMGDAELEVEEELLENNSNLEAIVLKTGHHGSNTSSSQSFLETVKPERAVISVGQDNQFGHPNLRIIKRLERAGGLIYRTDEAGTIRFKDEGKGLVFLE